MNGLEGKTGLGDLTLLRGNCRFIHSSPFASFRVWSVGMATRGIKSLLKHRGEVGDVKRFIGEGKGTVVDDLASGVKESSERSAAEA